ncbi:serine hydrolase [Streptomyces sp. NPDC059708]|uniref:D-alanyl-D-alanine carboxypeptidase n=1 Tax=Streptomyces sp. NPDC059708 TaxID=3346916 RepID=UPI0036B921A0
MKAESVAGDETGALAGREGSDTLALAGRGGAGTDAVTGREGSGAEAPTGGKAADAGAEAGREGAGADATAERKATDSEADTGREGADGEAPTGGKAADTGRNQAGRERADTAKRGQDDDADLAEREQPEADDAVAEPEHTGADAPTGRQDADTDDRTVRHPGQKNAEADALAGTEHADTDDVAGREQTDTDALAGHKDGHTDGRAEREDADTNDVAGRERADTALPKGPGQAESGSAAVSGRASAEGRAAAADSGSGARTAPGDGERLDADGASGARGALGDAEAVDAGADPAPTGTLAQEAEGGDGEPTPASEDGPASADAPGDDESPAPHAVEQEASAEPTRPGTGRRTEETAPQRGDQSGAKAPKATAEDGTGPSRRPSWAKRDDARPSGLDRRTAEGEETPDGASGPQDKTDAPARRPSWAQADGRAVAPSDDPERTSEFVALKDPRAARPAPAPWPEVLEPTRETPRPSLDLLAELTDTAPPAETPRRTLTRRVKVWTPIVLLLGGAVVGGQMLRPLPAPQLAAAQDSVTLDGQLTIPWPAKGQGAVRISGSGDVATFGEQKPTPTASVAKAMTAYLILKDHPLRKGEQGPQIEIDAQAAAESASGDESRIKSLRAGQTFSQREMLEMVMLPSANNIARLLARWDGGGGGEAAFVAKMNAAARELGMRDTTYTDPSGLNATTVSTAVDQLKLAEAAMRDETFRAVVETKSKAIKGVVERLDNSNKLLWEKELGNKGIKTGSSTAAGGTLVWAADKQIGDETPLILGALMEQRADGPDPQALRSLDLVLDNTRPINAAVRKALAATPVIHKGQTIGHVSDGLGGRTPLVATKDLSVIGVPGQKLRLTLGTAGGKSVPHEAKAGTEVAVLTVGEGPGAKTVPVAVGTRLAEPSFGTRVTRLS